MHLSMYLLLFISAVYSITAVMFILPLQGTVRLKHTLTVWSCVNCMCIDHLTFMTYFLAHQLSLNKPQSQSENVVLAVSNRLKVHKEGL